MWYVIQVRTGTEENIRCQCQWLISNDILERCFIPYYQLKKRFQGEWHIQEDILFPGYVFLFAQDLEMLAENLKRVVGLTRLIGTGDEIVPLSEAEITFLTKLGGGFDENIVKMSTGIIENDQIKVLSGPLKDMEGYIKKIDRHKRKAWISIEMFGRSIDAEIGLEIISKVTKEESTNEKEEHSNENVGT